MAPWSTRSSAGFRSRRPRPPPWHSRWPWWRCPHCGCNGRRGGLIRFARQRWQHGRDSAESGTDNKGRLSVLLRDVTAVHGSGGRGGVAGFEDQALRQLGFHAAGSTVELLLFGNPSAVAGGGRANFGHRGLAELFPWPGRG